MLQQPSGLFGTELNVLDLFKNIPLSQFTHWVLQRTQDSKYASFDGQQFQGLICSFSGHQWSRALKSTIPGAGGRSPCYSATRGRLRLVARQRSTSRKDDQTGATIEVVGEASSDESCAPMSCHPCSKRGGVGEEARDQESSEMGFEFKAASVGDKRFDTRRKEKATCGERSTADQQREEGNCEIPEPVFGGERGGN